MARRRAPVNRRRFDTEITVVGPSNSTVSNSAVPNHGTRVPGVITWPLASSHIRVKLSSPTNTVNSGRGRFPFAGAVAERVAISTNAAARRWAAVRVTPSR